MNDRRFLAIVVALFVGLITLAAVWIPSFRSENGLTPFRSYAELESYLDNTFGQYSSLLYGFERGGAVLAGPSQPAQGPSPAPPGAPDYSGTNVQVAGVDELDIVKTDGAYLYLAAGGEVVIVRATPPEEMRVVARVPVGDGAAKEKNASYVTGMFVLDGRLVVVSSAYSYDYGDVRPPAMYPMWRPPAEWTYVQGYDISNLAHPALEFSYNISGSPMTARMIAPYVYLIVSEPVTKVNETYEVPRVCRSDICASMPADQIYYDPTAQETAYYTNLLALNASSGESSILSILTGYASTVYMSHEALYLTYTKWQGGYAPFVTQSVPSVWTTIHKVRAHGIALEATVAADVAGTLLNQFSLDEHEGYLRAFTTVERYASDMFTRESNLFVLDESLNLVGSLAGLAPGESIHSVRFLGDRVYLVTFQKIDPFFVIDVSDPREPQVLGYLKIPGYSDYLHPMGDDYVLGIGKDTVPGETEDFSWYQGLKLSLFNVSDVAHPAELSKYVIGDRGTDSEVLRDHKAFLSIPSRGLVVLPVTLALINASRYPDGSPWAYGDPVWQGAYVLSVTPENGIHFVGRIAHANMSVDEWGNAYLDPAYQVVRSLYVGDTLYTISPSVVKANSLDDLTEIRSLAYA